MNFLFTSIGQLVRCCLISLFLVSSSIAYYINVSHLEVEGKVEGQSQRFSIGALHQRLQYLERQMSQHWDTVNSIFSQISVIYEEGGELKVAPIQCLTPEGHEVVFTSSLEREEHGLIDVDGLSMAPLLVTCAGVGSSSGVGSDEQGVRDGETSAIGRGLVSQKVYAREDLPPLDEMFEHIERCCDDPILLKVFEKIRKNLERTGPALESAQVHIEHLGISLVRILQRLSIRNEEKVLSRFAQCVEKRTFFPAQELIADSTQVLNGIKRDTDTATKNLSDAEADHKRALSELIHDLWHSEASMFHYLFQNTQTIADQIRAILGAQPGRRLHTIIHHAHSRNDMCDKCDRVYEESLIKFKQALAEALGQEDFGFGSVYTYSDDYGKINAHQQRECMYRDSAAVISLEEFQEKYPPTFFHKL